MSKPKIAAEERKGLEQRGHVLREQSALGVVQAITWQGLDHERRGRSEESRKSADGITRPAI